MTPSSPAWYRDPDNGLRHWDGRAWDGPRRRAPAWMQGTTELDLLLGGRREGDPVLEGPAHPAVLPATANAAAQSAGIRANLRTRGRPTGPQRPGRPGGMPPARLGTTRPVRRARWSVPGAVTLTVCSLVGLALVVLAVTVGIAPRPIATTVLAEDVGFVQAANRACGESMAAIRLAPTAAISAGGTSPVESLAAVTHANADLSRLAGEIRALPLDASAQTLVVGWLVNWSRFASDRRLWAARATRSVSSSAVTASGAASVQFTTVELDAADADQFATANGLDNCTLTAGASPLTAT